MFSSSQVLREPRWPMSFRSSAPKTGSAAKRVPRRLLPFALGGILVGGLCADYFPGLLLTPLTHITCWVSGMAITYQGVFGPLHSGTLLITGLTFDFKDGPKKEVPTPNSDSNKVDDKATYYHFEVGRYLATYSWAKLRNGVLDSLSISNVRGGIRFSEPDDLASSSLDELLPPFSIESLRLESVNLELDGGSKLPYSRIRPPPLPFIIDQLICGKKMRLADLLSAKILKYCSAEGRIGAIQNSGQFWIRHNQPQEAKTDAKKAAPVAPCHQWHFERLPFAHVQSLLALNNTSVPLELLRGTFDLDIQTNQSFDQKPLSVVLTCNAMLNNIQAVVPDAFRQYDTANDVAHRVTKLINNQTAGRSVRIKYDVGIDHMMVSSWKKGAGLEVSRLLISRMMVQLAAQTGVDVHITRLKETTDRLQAILEDGRRQMRELHEEYQNLKGSIGEIQKFYGKVLEEAKDSGAEILKNQAEQLKKETLNVVETTLDKLNAAPGADTVNRWFPGLQKTAKGLIDTVKGKDTK